MKTEFTLVSASVQREKALSEIRAANSIASDYGLSLSAKEAELLLETRKTALRETGRLEFGGGIIPKFIRSFANSPYLNRQNYVLCLDELVESFYYFKNESLDVISDDALIAIMRKNFDICHGALDLLKNKVLEAIAHNVRFGKYDYEDLEGLGDYENE